MTAADLRQALNIVGAVNRGGDFYCPCVVCQPGENEVTEFSCHLKPGRLYPIVAFCFRCCRPGDRPGVRSWWAKFLAALPEPVPEVCLRGASEEVINRCWAEIDARTESEAPAADWNVLHAVYSALLDSLDLSDRHCRWLKKRGLDPDWAYGVGYRTSPFDFLTETESDSPVMEITQSLYSRFGFSLAAIPGFVVDLDGQVQLRTRAPAVLTPCRDHAGRVFGLKHRMLDGGKVRMRWLSSKPAGGPQAVVGVHYPIGVGGHRWPRLWITEGERKADVHWLRRELPTVAIPGTGNWQAARVAVSVAVERGGEVVVALDQDDAGRRAAEVLTQALLGDGYRVFTASWTGKKGLDDAVLADTPVSTSETKVVSNSGLPPSALASDQRRVPQRLKDHEVLPYVREHGPVLANDLPAYPYTITKLVKAGHLRVTFTPKGQLLRAVQ